MQLLCILGSVLKITKVKQSTQLKEPDPTRHTQGKVRLACSRSVEYCQPKTPH